MKNWYRVQNLANKQASISVRGIVGDWGMTDQDLINEINALGDIESLEVRINSNGGDLVVALGLFNFLRNHPAKITSYIEGVAASAASVIAMAGDIIIMPSNTAMMIHNPWTFAAGNSKELSAAAEMLEKLENTLIKTYEARTKQSSDDIKAMLDAETWLTAQEAFELGFCDQVQDIGESYAIAMAKASGIPDDVLQKLNSVEPSRPAEEQAKASVEKSNKDTSGETADSSDDSNEVTELLNQSVQILCEAAGQLDLVESMQALAQTKGLQAVQAVLLKTQKNELSGINPQHASGHQFKSEQEKQTQNKLSALTMKAMNRK
ncbi:head maturation protease, ClpP-related [Thiomicrorhabdus sp.]|uniref:head maturation protease, ClpP-related n=1 Tax=Thiomicrorhabdus sp. TaxID=2039724 RepID=UPI0029C9826F|nr:head maturation protease, ClpP-related [Thiomicrorhabdus sp.]